MKYTKKIIRKIKNAKSDVELEDIIDKVYTDGWDDALISHFGKKEL